MAYMTWNDNNMESSIELEDESNICVMENHKNDKVTSYFFYDNLFCICK